MEPVVSTSGLFNLASANRRFKRLQAGIDRELVCQLGERKVHLLYTASGPRQQGMCRGIGFTEIRMLEIDGKRLVSAAEINSGCFSEPTLVSVRLDRVGDYFTLNLCHVSGWSWTNGYSGKVCKTDPIVLHTNGLLDSPKRGDLGKDRLMPLPLVFLSGRSRS
jgi:hypothetical protein